VAVPPVDAYGVADLPRAGTVSVLEMIALLGRFCQILPILSSRRDG